MEDSGFTTVTVLAVVVGVAIGVQRFAFQAADQTSNLSNNSTPAQLQQFTGLIVELLPLLVLVAAAAVLLSALDVL